MDINQYIESELFIIVPVLYVLGMLIKKSTVNDKWIPLILGIMGIALVTVYKLAINTPSGSSEIFSLIFSGITQGLLCASASVYANNIVKQFKKDDQAGFDDKSADKADKNGN